MITSRLRSRAQTTIPEAVREALKLRAGDEIAYVIEGGRVVLRRADDDLFENPFANFHEWDSPEDQGFDRL